MGKNLHGNLVNAIEESKSRDLFKLVTALGIRHVGAKGAKSLANKYKSLDNLMNASFEDLAMQNDVGEITAKSIYNFFKQPQTIDLINKLKEAGVNTKVIEIEGADNRFEPTDRQSRVAARLPGRRRPYGVQGPDRTADSRD